MTWTNFWPCCLRLDWWGHFSVHLQIKISSLVKSTKMSQHSNISILRNLCPQRALEYYVLAKRYWSAPSLCVASSEPRDGWVGREGGKLTRARFGPNLPICLLSPNHPIPAGKTRPNIWAQNMSMFNTHCVAM